MPCLCGAHACARFASLTLSACAAMACRHSAVTRPSRSVPRCSSSGAGAGPPAATAAAAAASDAAVPAAPSTAAAAAGEVAGSGAYQQPHSSTAKPTWRSGSCASITAQWRASTVAKRRACSHVQQRPSPYSSTCSIVRQHAVREAARLDG
eukprot:scaffold4044_cov78-Phaeocystis_antarctica.AAC.7